MVRIRFSNRGKNDAVAAAARDVDFRHLWRQLRGAGWTSRRPTGIQTDWSYVSPDGARVFAGEDTVVVHALESGLLAQDAQEECKGGEESMHEKTTGATANTSNDEEEVEGVDSAAAASDIRASQIDTTAQLSQNTLDELFGPDIDSDVGLSQTAVTRAFDVAPSDFEAVEAQRDAVMNLQLLSEASGDESDSVQDKPVPVSPGPVLRPRIGLTKDVNFVPDDEDMSAYESFSSGESDGDEIAESDEDMGAASDTDDDDVVTESDAVQLDEAFVQSLQIGSTALSKKDLEARAATLRAMPWSTTSSTFEEEESPYPGLNMEEAQSALELRSLCHSPLLPFFYFMPKTLWVSINEETNRYCDQHLDRRAQASLANQSDQPLPPGRKRETLTQIRRRLMAQAGYRTHEILRVVCLLVARMLCPQKRRFAAHWTMTEDGAVLAGTFGRFMSRNRAKIYYETYTL
ncbi:hypothetical protein V7S43_019045 [Phytophthora oleae]|uniref:PiggyBac transposable element-derived protein domain-containing protein n=1 Tax=Phytophthora oleae TaxID=2107226 RepID=A0ABD3G645_9STRA